MTIKINDGHKFTMELAHMHRPIVKRNIISVLPSDDRNTEITCDKLSFCCVWARLASKPASLVRTNRMPEQNVNKANELIDNNINYDEHQNENLFFSLFFSFEKTFLIYVRNAELFRSKWFRVKNVFRFFFCFIVTRAQMTKFNSIAWWANAKRTNFHPWFSVIHKWI